MSSRLSVDHGRELTIANGVINQVDPLVAEAEPPQDAKKEIPIHAVVGFEHVEFNGDVASSVFVAQLRN